ncbi:hypothetical protein U6N30_18615 [Blastococcus brunescens]|uniref:ABC transporter domain-containing protein n=1 Tax=Blastococcus brunescens TaxID=1564165 RepID=A0ABZ1B8D5_9ACTN|nr:hypothetical protein [Blastococcus sp. BMG 8361]WRL67059.1 hypothetical protein U6N30_18615 [Blastococcus sp. BMG 8361]
MRGRSGSGKSTLLAVLAGLVGPDATLAGTVDGVPASVASVPQFPGPAARPWPTSCGGTRGPGPGSTRWSARRTSSRR